MTTNELFAKLTEANDAQTKLLTEKIESTFTSFKTQLRTCQINIDKLNHNAIQYERRLRKNNIVIFGLTTSDNLLEDTLKTLNNLLGCKLCTSDVNNITILRKNNTGAGPILLEFISFLKKVEVFKNVSKLKGTSVSISNDLCPEDRDNHRVLVKYLKEAKFKNLPAQIKGNKLVIDGKIYTVDELRTEESEEVSEKSDSEEDATGQLVENTAHTSTNKRTPEQPAKKRKYIKNQTTDPEVKSAIDIILTRNAAKVHKCP